MLVASAIKFKIERTGKEVILCGVRHGDCFRQLEALGFEPRKGYEEIEQGFVDNYGVFRNRNQALLHAVQCGQLNADMRGQYSRGEKKTLYSEDLW